MSHDAPETGATSGKGACATLRGTYLDGLAPPSLSRHGTRVAAGILSSTHKGSPIPAGLVWITSPHLYSTPKFKARAAAEGAIVMATIYCPDHHVSVLEDGGYVEGGLVEDCCGCRERRKPAASTDTGGPKVRSKQNSGGKFGLRRVFGRWRGNLSAALARLWRRWMSAHEWE